MNTMRWTAEPAECESPTARSAKTHTALPSVLTATTIEIAAKKSAKAFSSDDENRNMIAGTPTVVADATKVMTPIMAVATPMLLAELLWAASVQKRNPNPPSIA
jgi:hypothetical protein